MTGAAKPYSPGQLRIVRDATAPLTADKAYHVEEVAEPHARVSTELLTEKTALNLMWDLGSPYPGPRYPDDPWAWGRQQAAKTHQESTPSHD